ncbi:glycosyltransferase [Edwardsiella tarda]|uniref:glycosyltransferase n=1 Tax=Edwardsiella tarda TaxID=636 RepID=UPI0034DD0BAB
MQLSVVMSIYSEPLNMIKKSINSILAQSFIDFEFIIVNDNPYRDENMELLSEYSAKDSRIKIITNSENIGLTKSLNNAISMSSGNYIARMDADDIAIDKRFEIQVKFLDEHPDIDVCGSNVYVIDENDCILKKYIYPTTSAKIKTKLFFRDCICHPSVVFRRSFFYEVDGYSEYFLKAQDYDLWIKGVILEKGFFNIKEPLLYYRMHALNISTKNINEQDIFSFRAKLKLYTWLSDNKKGEGIASTIDSCKDYTEVFKLIVFCIQISFSLARKIKGFSYVYFYSLLVKRFLYLTLIKGRK